MIVSQNNVTTAFHINVGIEDTRSLVSKNRLIKTSKSLEESAAYADMKAESANPCTRQLWMDVTCSLPSPILRV